MPALPHVVRRLAACLGALSLVVIVTGCDFGGLQGTDGKQYIDGKGVPVLIKPSDRGEPVEAAGEDLDGNPISLADYRGKVVMVNTWGSWCTPCVRETPALVALAQTFATHDPSTVQMVGVNIRQDGGADEARTFAREQGMTYPSFYDPGGSVLLRLSDKLGPYSVPSTVVLDQQGRVAALVLGSIPGQVSMREIVEQVVAGG